MLAYLAKRFGQALFILVGITLVTYVLLYLVPADPVRQIAGRSATAETVESIRHQLGLDRPIPVQYLSYVGKLALGKPLFKIISTGTIRVGTCRATISGKETCEFTRV